MDNVVFILTNAYDRTPEFIYVTGPPKFMKFMRLLFILSMSLLKIYECLRMGDNVMNNVQFKLFNA